MTDHPARQPVDPRPESVSFFVTCLVDQFKPQVGDAVVEVLESAGVGVDVPGDQTCCGQPAFNSGFRKEAREVASRFLDIFDSQAHAHQPIITPSGSCAAMVRNYYPVLFRDDPAELDRAKRVADRLWEFSEFLVDGLGVTNDPKPAPETAISPGQSHDLPEEKIPLASKVNQARLAYHRCCHAMRELGIDRQPVALLDGVDDLTLARLERSEVCCGFGGSFAVKMPDISTAMLDEKLDNIEASGAGRLIAGDTGCIMHMEGGLRRRGSSIQVLHIAELLAETVRFSSARQSATPTRALEAVDPKTLPASGPGSEESPR